MLENASGKLPVSFQLDFGGREFGMCAALYLLGEASDSDQSNCSAYGDPGPVRAPDIPEPPRIFYIYGNNCGARFLVRMAGDAAAAQADLRMRCAGKK